MSTLSIGDLLVIGANGEGTPGWSYNNIKGWYDFDQDQVDSDPRPGQDGSFSADESYSSQATPSVEGVFVSGSAFEVAQAKMLLRTLKNQGLKQPIVWDDHGLVTQRRAFVVRATPLHSAGRSGFKWAIDMFSSDPALYGVSLFTGPVSPISRGEGGLRFDGYTGTTYEWEGAANASPTTVRVNGVFARRNLVSDPDTTALTRWAIPSADISKADTKIRIVPNGSSTCYIYPVTDPSVGNGGGRYFAAPGARITMRNQMFNVGTETTWVRPGIAYYTSTGAGSTTTITTFGPAVQLAPGAGARLELAATMQTADPNTTGFLPIVYVYPTATGGFATSVNAVDTVNWTVETGPTAPANSPYEHFSGATPNTGEGPGLIFPETYGALGSDGRLKVYNPGTAPAYSIFTFVGGSSQGFSITKISTAESISVEREIPAGAIVVVNPRTGRVTIDGASNDISGSLRDDDWFTTAPGATDQVQLGILGTAYGSPTLSAETQPAY